MAAEETRFLHLIASGIRALVGQGDNISTLDFAVLVDRIIIVFDFLGPVLHFARADMHAKCETLKKASAQHATLREVIEADKKAGVAQQKNSCARNLHRLALVIKFMRLLLEKLLEGNDITVKDAASFAYGPSLAPIHPYVVKTAVWAGMYLLPTRQAFLKDMDETEASAKGPAEEFYTGASLVESHVLAMFDVDMPASTCIPDNMFPTWWGSKTATA